MSTSPGAAEASAPVAWAEAGARPPDVPEDAWGNLEAGAGEPGHAFTGREWDPETGLYYYRARYYDPKLGRFISEDPIGFAVDVNFYAYVKNNPVRWTDAYGLQVFPPGYWDLVITHGIVQQIRQEVRQWPNPHADTDTSNRIRHCIVSCRVSREAPGGTATAYVAGDLFQDPVFVPAGIGVHMPQNWNIHSDPGDRRANAIGRCAATSEPNKSCEDACLGHYPEMYQPGEDPRFSGRR